MGRSLRGAARREHAALNAEVKEASALMRAHRKGCLDCRHAITNPHLFCDDGWEMAKRESRAKYALYVFKEEIERGQERLF